MYRLGSLICCAVAILVCASAMPQDVSNLAKEDDVNTRYYSGKRNYLDNKLFYYKACSYIMELKTTKNNATVFF